MIWDKTFGTYTFMRRVKTIRLELSGGIEVCLAFSRSTVRTLVVCENDVV